MAQLSAEQLTDQGDAWRAYGTALQAYQTERSGDPAFDNVTAMQWIDNAFQLSKQYYLSAINAAYDDANDAFTKLQAVTQQSTADVAALQATVNSWNRFASIAASMENLVVALAPPFNPINIYSAINGVVGATSGSTSTAK